MSNRLNLERVALPEPTRLDRVLRQHFPSWGRQAVQRAIIAGTVQVNGRNVWLASWQVRNGDSITISDPPGDKPSAPLGFDAAWLIADDGEIIAVNKPAGLLSEPAKAPNAVNLRDLARAYFAANLTLFHRLDRDTSGVMLLTRPGPINKLLSAAFQSGAVNKQYLALVAAPNRLEDAGVIAVRLAPDPQRHDRMVVASRGGQPAITRYQVEQRLADRLLVRLWPQTGRTHQLRVHLAHMGAPILGDRLYGDAASAPRLMLHAQSIDVTLSSSGVRSFSAQAPAEFASLVACQRIAFGSGFSG